MKDRFTVSVSIQEIEKEDSDTYGFSSINEAYNHEYPIHRDNYNITEWDYGNLSDGLPEIITSVSLSLLDGSEDNLSQFI